MMGNWLTCIHLENNSYADGGGELANGSLKVFSVLYGKARNLALPKAENDGVSVSFHFS